MDNLDKKARAGGGLLVQVKSGRGWLNILQEIKIFSDPDRVLLSIHGRPIRRATTNRPRVCHLAIWLTQLAQPKSVGGACYMYGGPLRPRPANDPHKHNSSKPIHRIRVVVASSGHFRCVWNKTVPTLASRTDEIILKRRRCGCGANAVPAGQSVHDHTCDSKCKSGAGSGANRELSKYLMSVKRERSFGWSYWRWWWFIFHESN